MDIKSLEELADKAAKLVLQLELKKPVYIGASLGGFIAQLIARKHPEEPSTVSAFILLAVFLQTA